MHIKWSFRRQFLYYGVAVVVLAVLSLATYTLFLNSPPSCSDGRQNADEHGVDCGGSCSLVCAVEAHDPVVLWARAFRTSPQTYTVAAYVQNPNVSASTKALPYVLQLFDDHNLLVVEISGSLDIPPVRTVPIVAPNVVVGQRTVARTLLSFTGTPPVWRKSAPLPTLRIGNQRLAADGSTLSATIYNDSNVEVRDVVASAVLFDTVGTALSASKSILSRLGRKESQDIVFTWSGGVQGSIRAEITILSAF